MPKYLASYTVYFAQSESDKRHFQSIFEMDPGSFSEREGWGEDLKKPGQYRFEAQNEKHALKCAEIYRNFLSTSRLGQIRIGATLDEILEIRSVNIKSAEPELHSASSI